MVGTRDHSCWNVLEPMHLNVLDKSHVFRYSSWLACAKMRLACAWSAVTCGGLGVVVGVL